VHGVGDRSGGSRPRVLIAGGGVAGLETAAALATLAPGLADVTVVAPEPEFVYKPLIVDEPFAGAPAPRYELEPLLTGLDAGLLAGALASVDAGLREVVLADGSRHGYEKLVVCVGGVPKPAYPDVVTFWSRFAGLRADELIEDAAARPARRLTLVVPPGVTWSLPIYEIALMLRRRSIELGHERLRISLLTAEEAPLGVFGRAAVEAITETLANRSVAVRAGVRVVADEGVAEDSLVGVPLPRAEPVVALPVISGPRIDGLPSDPGGFLPIDSHCAVVGVTDVYAAGDGTSFPVKQGGIATQEADAAAEHIAAALGADVEPSPFRPVLRGKLFTGPESLSMRSAIAGGEGEGAVSPDPLWWPPAKIAGRYLSNLFEGEAGSDVDPGGRPLEVDVSWPHEWHAQPGIPGLGGD
jgi:sulfide:quinone oxidoreductase